MCGGWACQCDKPKHLLKYKNEPLVQRTIRLLKQNGVEDIAITTSPNRVDMYNKFGVEVIPYEANNKPFVWLDAFYPTEEPVCYIFGDVVFSPEAIRTIVVTKTDEIEFFASAPPFAKEYPKKYAEPFAFKVVNQTKFQEDIRRTKEFSKFGVFYRRPISWELWQVIKDTQPNKISYDNYVVINDYTCDVDSEDKLQQWNNI